jgi:hypothetical protein
MKVAGKVAEPGPFSSPPDLSEAEREVSLAVSQQAPAAFDVVSAGDHGDTVDDAGRHVGEGNPGPRPVRLAA